MESVGVESGSATPRVKSSVSLLLLDVPKPPEPVYADVSLDESTYVLLVTVAACC